MAEDFDRTTLARNLQRARLVRGLTQAQLAARVAIPVKLYGRYETAHRWPSVETLRRLCVVLQVSADALLALPAEDPATVPGPEDTPEMRRLLHRLQGASADRLRFVASLLAEMDESEAD